MTMTAMTGFRRAAIGVALAAMAAAGLAAQTPSPFPTVGHGAVGSWFGKAEQLCPAGTAPSACSNGSPAITLMMTPTIISDGQFLGNDSMTLGGPPFGPHTTAHGTWIATSPTEFVADYVFMLNAYPPHGDGAVQALRFRWSGVVVDKSTLVGWVNVYFTAPIPQTWQPLLTNEFPAFPPEALPAVTAPTTFYKDPTQCLKAGCPLVFKFMIKRVAP
jgi:hypothetical protein